VVEPDVHRDARGFFLETYHREKYAAGGITAAFVQDNHSRSGRGTLRGLHAQVKRPQGKLVRVVEGEIYDVALDIRPGSPTFGRAVGMSISGEDFRQIWIPPGFAHGFCVLSEVAHVEYKCTEMYDAGDEVSILWSDPDLGITWPIRDPIVSAKDSRAPRLREIAPKL
jgi:dTDP-4-dehydrorhamnose 3,5-epimerase